MAKILIVEDDELIRELYRTLLEDAGHQVDLAPDGEIGLCKARLGGYDLILLDIILPKKDGISILKALRKNPPQKANKKIVAMSVLDQAPFIKTALKLGAHSYLMKAALDSQGILNEVKNLLKEEKPS